MKVFKKVLAAAMSVAMMAISVTAFATDATYSVKDSVPTVTLTAPEGETLGLKDSGQLTVVVVAKDFGETDGTAATADNIFYINQDAAGTAFDTILGNMGLKDSIDLTAKDYEVRVGNEEGTIVKFTVKAEGGTVTIMYGDANDDTTITTEDAIVVLKKLAEMTVTLGAGADANADGSITTEDAILILKYLAEMDVTLGPKA